MTSQPTHWFEEHTGEVQLHLVAPTLGQLFEEAPKALAELMVEQLAEGPAPSVELVKLSAPDREALIVEWLNELIFRSETQQKIYGEARILRLSDTELEAEIRGKTPERLGTAVKAATYHRLKIVSQENGYAATVILDV